LFNEDETCPDARHACGERPDPDVCGEGALPDAGAGVPGEGEQGGQRCRCYPSLPEAIAPSLASTPTFARRNTSWCHALEVKIIFLA